MSFVKVTCKGVLHGRFVFAVRLLRSIPLNSLKSFLRPLSEAVVQAAESHD